MKIFSKNFWNNKIGKFLRWLLIIPCYFIALGLVSLINYLIFLLLSWFFSFNTIVTIIVVIFLFGILSELGYILVFLCIPFSTFYIIKICPSKKIGSIVFFFIIIFEGVTLAIKAFPSLENYEGIFVLLPFVILFVYLDMLVSSIIMFFNNDII